LGVQDDGCGNNVECGSCEADFDCNNGICEEKACVAKTCADFNNLCGSFDNGCESTIECGCNDALVCQLGTCVAETCNSTLEGIYNVAGNDLNGNYTGKLEVKKEGSGENQIIKFYREITYTDFSFTEDNAKVAQVLEGTITENANNLNVNFEIDKVGFIKLYGNQAREQDFNNNPPVAFTGSMNLTACDSYSGDLNGNALDLKYHDTWVRVADNGANPIWKNERVDLPTTADGESTTINMAGWATEYDPEEYNNHPEVAPYKDKQEFQDKIHFWTFDPTDYDFYQKEENKNTYRVIQKVVDTISIVEARQRNRAYKYTLKEKEALFQEELKRVQINEYGIVSRWDAGANRFAHDGDALLWTGVYTAAMAKKYMVTRDRQAMIDMLKSLNGVISSIEVVQDAPNDNLGETFARTIMKDLDPGIIADEWRAGTLRYPAGTQVYYKRGGNNDMTKGFFIGIMWGYKALKLLTPAEYQEVRAAYGDIIKRGFDALSALRSEHGDLFLNKCRSYRPDQAKKWPNTIHMNLVYYEIMRSEDARNGTNNYNVGFFEDDIKSCYSALTTYWGRTDLNYMNSGGIVSDWSGNHLGIWGLYNNYRNFISLAGAQADEAIRIRELIRDANGQMGGHRIGLFRMIGEVEQKDPGYWETHENPNGLNSAIWRMREMPYPRKAYHVDWKINPKFTVSPYPELLWKFKKADTSDRLQSLRAYPIFESVTSSYYWKDNPFNKFRGLGWAGQSGIDFVIAYWFGRYHKVISENE